MDTSSAGQARDSRAAVVGALLLVQLFFGLHYVAAKIVLGEIPPRAWATLRAAAAAALLLVLARLIGRRPRLRARDLASLAVCSLFGVTINQICFVEGLERTTPTHSAIINTTIPVGTLLFAVLFGRERLTYGKASSLAVSLAGVLLVIHPTRAALAMPTSVGDLLTLVNALSYSLFLVLSKRVLSRTDPLDATAALLGSGSIGILAVGWPQLLRFEPSGVSWTTWGLAGFVVVFATVGAYFLNFWALARVDSSVVAIFIYLQPLIAAALSATVLGERPGLHVAAGGALVFLGVYLALGPRSLSEAGRRLFSRARRSGTPGGENASPRA